MFDGGSGDENRTVLYSELPGDWSETDFREIFCHVGSIKSLKSQRKTGSTTSVLVTYETSAVARRSIGEFQGANIGGKACRAEFSKTRQNIGGVVVNETRGRSRSRSRSRGPERPERERSQSRSRSQSQSRNRSQSQSRGREINRRGWGEPDRPREMNRGWGEPDRPREMNRGWGEPDRPREMNRGWGEPDRPRSSSVPRQNRSRSRSRSQSVSRHPPRAVSVPRSTSQQPQRRHNYNTNNNNNNTNNNNNNIINSSHYSPYHPSASRGRGGKGFGYKGGKGGKQFRSSSVPRNRFQSQNRSVEPTRFKGGKNRGKNSWKGNYSSERGGGKRGFQTPKTFERSLFTQRPSNNDFRVHRELWQG